MFPKPGEIWEWYDDDSGTAEHYGPGIVLEIKEGYDWDSQDFFVSFHFADHGVFNIPMSMVKRFMHHVKKT